MNIKTQNKLESFKSILPTLGKRQKNCLEGLIELGGKASANQLARYLLAKGVIPYYNTNFTNPRLIELEQDGVVTVIGKVKDEITGRSCSIYKLVQPGFGVR
ncbi:hypothetical protein [Bacillus wiedmannii]|uniref:hypothetical protein n=1 Tax=Bacillus wiedmannii TaxID=1890302 RepID=UPI000BF1FFD0|nr:hypothetical protein [Bacillus wiedmannii]PEN61575.1 hypothetical protein CN576_21300 [Bacillus wiedmannii]PHA62821.1 hypothetical protein COE75_16405 [Bacillus wiedmannii]